MEELPPTNLTIGNQAVDSKVDASDVLMVKSDQKLVAQIERAFADVPYPGDDHICAGVTEAHRTFLSEEASIEAIFRGLHWREVPLENLVRNSATLGFLTPEAYRFYLPAYLLAWIGLSMDDVERIPGANNTEGSLFYSLQPASHDPVLRDYVHRRIDPLTLAQKAAVRAFLHEIRRKRVLEGYDLLDEEMALFAYWGFPEGHPSPLIQEANDPLPPVIPGAKPAGSGERIVDGKNSQLIQRLIWSRFVHVDQREDGWTKLYYDPSGAAYWELTYPCNQMDGGGPPTLSRLSAEQVKALYRLPALEQH